MLRRNYNFQESKNKARPYEWYIDPKHNNKTYAVHYSQNGKLHHIRLHRKEYLISKRGKISSRITKFSIECRYPFCEYKDNIKLLKWKSYLKSCNKKHKHNTLTQALEYINELKHKGIYCCEFCKGYHTTTTVYNPKIKGHTKPVFTIKTAIRTV